MVPRETVSFVFPRVLFPETKLVKENIRIRGKTKLTSFPRDHTLVLCYLLNNHQNKQTKTALLFIRNPLFC